MRSLWRTTALLAWALWFGGLITLFVCVVTLFHFDRAIAVQAAPQLFHVFERYQLILAAAAIVSALLWKRKALAGLFCIAAVGALTSPLVTTPKIMELQRLGLTHTGQFARLHGESMLIYMADAALLLVGGLILSNRSSH
jgi:hypothetical protein